MADVELWIVIWQKCKGQSKFTYSWLEKATIEQGRLKKQVLTNVEHYGGFERIMWVNHIPK